jgi:dimethylamine/trimethylamine dehydrogenase
VAARLAVADEADPEGFNADEAAEVLSSIGELPDLWDVNVADWSADSLTARFGGEGFQETRTAFVKQLTSKPVVGVGRFTSPDAMASQIRRGILDLIGAARPSIADPFLPRKIEEGRLEQVRECIGCNICAAQDNIAVPIRCTQNPTMGEEWRRGWHPERVPPGPPAAPPALVVGAGPAGLECARILGERGYDVFLAEASRQLGGRILHERTLPGLSSWMRVIDYRVECLRGLSNVEIYPESSLTAEDILALGRPTVFLATGSRWRRDGFGRSIRYQLKGLEHMRVMTPDDLFAGEIPASPIVIWDDDNYYMGGAIAERMRREGHDVRLVTAAPEVSAWTHHTMEQWRIQKTLLELGVEIICSRVLAGCEPGAVELACAYTGRLSRLECETLMLITARGPVNDLWNALAAHAGDEFRIERLGDALAPGTIAAAVNSGYRAGRELDVEGADSLSYRREPLA